MPQLQPTTPPPRLPLDVIHSIFEFYIQSTTGFGTGLWARQGGQHHHKKVLRFGGVCRDWHRASMWQSCYAIHDTAGSNGRKRLGDLRQLLHYRGTCSGVKEFCFGTSFKAGTWVMADNPILSELIDTVATTLTFLQVHLTQEDLEGGNLSANTDNMRLLFQSMSRVERLEELDLSVMTPIPVGEYITFLRDAKALRHCHLDVMLSLIVPEEVESERVDWRSFPHSLHSSTPWHQLTSLSVECTNSSLPLIAIILTSGTITQLKLGGGEDPNDPPSNSAFQNLFSAIEAYSTPIIDFAFNFRRPWEVVLPPLDHLLPFLTSCTYLCIHAAYLDSSYALSSMPNLKSLSIIDLLLESDTHLIGLALDDVLLYVSGLKPGRLEWLAFDYESYFFREATHDDREDLTRLKEMARLLKLELHAGEEGDLSLAI